MKEPVLVFPVTCPLCQREEAATLPLAYVAAALLKNTVIRLYASCHDIYWDARAVETEQIREYLAMIGVGEPTVHRARATESLSLDDKPIGRDNGEARIRRLPDFMVGGRLPREEV